MKSDIHPEIHPVVFVDGDHEIVTRSTITTKSTKMINGVEHYVIPIEISSFTHPFYTGQQRIVDTAGQVERFMRRLESGAEQRQRNVDRAEAERQAEVDAKRKRRGLVPFAESVEEDEDQAESTDGESAED